MTPAEHYETAEEILADLLASADDESMTNEDYAVAIAQAQVHATLATVYVLPQRWITGAVLDGAA